MQGEERFLAACHRQRTDAAPIWFMRQAGRVLPEYRALKERFTFLELARETERIVEVTLLPFRHLDVDAAIIFADIMLPLDGMGVPFTIAEGVGPVIDEPVRTLEQIRALRRFDPREELGYLMEAIRIVRRELAGNKALIGFAGAPFTLACYLVEGRPSRDYARAKQLMYSEPQAWRALMETLADVQLAYLRAQIEAGAQAVQLFDSWVGELAPEDYEANVLPYSRRIFDGLAETGVPSIHFGRGGAALLELMASAGGDVISVDWRVPLDRAWERIGLEKGIQGNLDPAVLLAPFDAVQERAGQILERAGGRPGHIFNLGHGLLPQTGLENLKRLVDWVHETTGRDGR